MVRINGCCGSCGNTVLRAYRDLSYGLGARPLTALLNRQLWKTASWWGGEGVRPRGVGLTKFLNFCTKLWNLWKCSYRYINAIFHQFGFTCKSTSSLLIDLSFVQFCKFLHSVVYAQFSRNVVWFCKQLLQKTEIGFTKNFANNIIRMNPRRGVLERLFLVSISRAKFQQMRRSKCLHIWSWI